MIYKEEYRDLFSVSDDYYLAHCISADFGMGRGIAIEFNKRFNMKRRLQIKYPNYTNEWHVNKTKGCCIVSGKVFNLVTKEHYFQKPTYESMRIALESMKRAVEICGVTKIAMPIIGCGLDRLKWDKVSEIIKEVFENVDVEILVCKQ